MTTRHLSWPVQCPTELVVSYPGNEGRFTGVLCPMCGSDVVYNGNYFCVRWSYECDWALSHNEPTGKPDAQDLPTWEAIRRVWFAIHGTELRP